jgi:hypothetical protein
MSNIIAYDVQERMAHAIAKSGLFGIKTPDQALALMAVAQAEGRHPGSVARDYHIIQNRPALRADAMLARFQDAGGSVKWLVYTDEEVKAEFAHPKGGSLTLSWTFDQARKIGLTTKDNWKNYPRAMLRARVISEGIRTVYPGVLTGEYTPEEIQDMQPEKVNIVELDASEFADEPTEGIEFYVPDGGAGQVTLFSVERDLETWKAKYDDMMARISSSRKLTENQKTEKLWQLRAANLETMQQIEKAKEAENNDGE